MEKIPRTRGEERRYLFWFTDSDKMRTGLSYLAKFFRLLTGRRRDYPEEIQLEVTNACNLTCAMCPHTFGEIPHEHFPLTLFEQMVQNNPAPKRLVLTGWGEPLLHPDFFALIDTANRHWPQTQVRFTTNGVLLNHNNREAIAQRNIAQITVSIDLWPDHEPRPDLHRFLHPTSPKTLANIEEYAHTATLSQKTPVTLQCMLLEDTYDDIRQLIAFARKNHLHRVNLVRLQLYPGLPLERPLWDQEQQMISDLKAFGRKKKVKVRSLNQQNLWIRLATGFDTTCLKTDDSLYILLDGTVTPCCNLRKYTIGSLKDNPTSLQEIWHSQQETDFFANQSPTCGKCDALFHRYKK